MPATLAPTLSSASLFQRLRQWLGGEPAQPITVGVDVGLMQPDGANGGVKPLVFSFLREIGRTQGRRIRFVYFCQPDLAPELNPLLRTGDELSFSSSPAPAIEVLYAVFGRSSMMRPGLPAISLIVDLLHKDLPSALPVEEVNYRHAWFTAIAEQATFFQCISHYTAARLQHHYAIPAHRCFVTHIPVHRRLPVPPTASSNSSSAKPPFFFYPANFWPHKNHETLLAAYRSYFDRTGPAAWPLVLTGHPDARMSELRERSASLGLHQQVHFLGHLDDVRFSAVWRSAGALVYPSLHEGFGIPLLEAMEYGCPIIASRVTSLPEVGGDACFYVDPSNIASIATAFTQVAGDAALRASLVRRGARRLRTFSLIRETRKLARHLRAAQRPR